MSGSVYLRDERAHLISENECMTDKPFTRRLCSCCSYAAVRKRLPILNWLPQYSLQWLKLDLIAGLTVGLTVVPQALAYAEVAGLPVQYGLYSSFMGCFVYCVLGTSKDITLGPTAIMSLLCASYIDHDPVYAVLLTFLCGIIQCVTGILHLARNAVVVLSAAVVAFVFTDHNLDVFTLTGKTAKGLPPFRPPFFSEKTENETLSFKDITEDLGAGLAVIPLMGLLESISIAKAFGSENDYRIDTNQEILAIGLTNILGSFVSSYPVTGSFGRTAVNSQTGSCTPAGGLVTGSVVLLSLAYLMPLFYYIPKAALASVIICAVLPMFDYTIFKKLWKVKKMDLLPFLLTFIMCFWEIQYGIVAGVILSSFILLYRVSRPQIQISGEDVVVLKLQSELNFPAMQYFSDTLYKEALKASPPRSAIVDLHRVNYIDYTVVKEMEDLLRQFKDKKLSLVFTRLSSPCSRPSQFQVQTGAAIKPCAEISLDDIQSALQEETPPSGNTDSKGDRIMDVTMVDDAVVKMGDSLSADMKDVKPLKEQKRPSEDQNEIPRARKKKKKSRKKVQTEERLSVAGDRSSSDFSDITQEESASSLQDISLETVEEKKDVENNVSNHLENNDKGLDPNISENHDIQMDENEQLSLEAGVEAVSKGTLKAEEEVKDFSKDFKHREDRTKNLLPLKSDDQSASDCLNDFQHSESSPISAPADSPTFPTHVQEMDCSVDRDRDKVILRAGDPIGNWEENLTEITVRRDLDECGLLVEGCLVVSKKNLKHVSIPYNSAPDFCCSGMSLLYQSFQEYNQLISKISSGVRGGNVLQKNMKLSILVVIT
ncbi:S2611 protein, partial [Polypterus senegalus]